MTNFIVYDIESFPNFFSFAAYDLYRKEYFFFEVSWRRNDLGNLLHYLDWLESNEYYMIGYNNWFYDYPFIHELMTGYGYHDAASIYAINQRLISIPYHEKWSATVAKWDCKIKQIDLLLIHHFDNKAKTTSLKRIEFVMRSKTIEESKYPFGVPLPETDQAANETLAYNKHDIDKTAQFAIESWKEIQFRFTMTAKYGRDFINHNDTKIGKDYFIMELEKAGVHVKDANGNKRQTPRNEIRLRDCIFPQINFQRPEFKRVHEKLLSTTIYETKGALKISAVLDGFSFDFALGGIHGSVKGQDIRSDDEYIIIDADVASYYPNIAIVNNLYPEHLSNVFCKVYKDVYLQRKSYAKKTVENAAMKLALNGVYGDSNNPYSVFYDPKYTMTVTLNGQLLLCMLAESLMVIPNLTMLQINTDGMTVKLPRKYYGWYMQVCKQWEQFTQLELEYVEYSRMLIRDVNNYIAIPVEGKAKFKGAYVHTGAHEKDSENDKLDWHKNHSALIVKKACSECVLNGTPVDYFIRNHKNIYDFFSVTNISRTGRLEMCKDMEILGAVYKDQVVKKEQPNSRYLVVNNGLKMIKVLPPLKRRTKNVKMIFNNWQSKKINGYNKLLTVTNEAEYEHALRCGYITIDGGSYRIGPERKSEIEKGYKTAIYNTVESENVQDYDINYDYYIEQANKLVAAMIGIDYEQIDYDEVV